MNRSERKHAEELLEHNAFYDLTDLSNRALFADRLQHALIHAQRHTDYKFAVLLADIDEFKVINDSLGHSAGDELLIQIAKRLCANFRDTNSLARPGNPAQSLNTVWRDSGATSLQSFLKMCAIRPMPSV